MALQFRGKYQLAVHDDSITCVAFSIKGDYVASGGLRRRLQIFSLDDGKLHYSIITPSSIKSLIWLPGAEQTLVCACHSGMLMNVVIRPGVST
jgi:WD40 repeat protein